MKLIKPWSFLFLLCCFFAPTKAQLSDSERPQIANEILDNARSKIFLGSSQEISTLKLKTQGNSYVKTKLIIGGKRPITIESREALNAESLIDISNYQAKSRMQLLKKDPIRNDEIEIIVNITTNGKSAELKSDAKLNGKSLNLGKAFSNIKDIARQLNLSALIDDNGLPKLDSNEIYLQILGQFHPFILSQPKASDWKFKYIGNAESDGIVAEVLELIQEFHGEATNFNKSSITRYFFDIKSKQLLMISNISEDNFTTISSTSYYSDFKIIGGIEIPTHIKIEEKFKSKKVMEVLGFKISEYNLERITDIDVVSFEINPVFPPGTFSLGEK
ncbi:MAG: hypothetical protein ACK5NT_05655 [Pyrinomonadaceae bacterium]